MDLDDDGENAVDQVGEWVEKSGENMGKELAQKMAEEEKEEDDEEEEEMDGNSATESTKEMDLRSESGDQLDKHVEKPSMATKTTTSHYGLEQTRFET